MAVQFLHEGEKFKRGMIGLLKGAKSWEMQVDLGSKLACHRRRSEALHPAVVYMSDNNLVYRTDDFLGGLSGGHT